MYDFPGAEPGRFLPLYGNRSNYPNDSKSREKESENLKTFAGGTFIKTVSEWADKKQVDAAISRYVFHLLFFK